MTMLIPTFNRLDFVDLAKVGQVEGREPLQSMWHPWIARWTGGKSVLDVGSGVSVLKRDLLALGARSVTTQDPCAWCHCDLSAPIEQIQDPFDVVPGGGVGEQPGVIARTVWAGAFDVVTCIDVLEHVMGYGGFAWHLARLAGERVIITTPGVRVRQNLHPYHYHEFHCDEVVQLFEATGLRLELLRVYEGQTLIELAELPARKLAAQDPVVHPMGFVFVKPGVQPVWPPGTPLDHLPAGCPIAEPPRPSEGA